MRKGALNIAVKAARTAGSVITRHMNRLDSLTIVEKGRNDFASEVDRLAEAEIVREIWTAVWGEKAAKGEVNALHRGKLLHFLSKHVPLIKRDPQSFAGDAQTLHVGIKMRDTACDDSGGGKTAIAKLRCPVCRR